MTAGINTDHAYLLETKCIVAPAVAASWVNLAVACTFAPTRALKGATRSTTAAACTTVHTVSASASHALGDRPSSGAATSPAIAVIRKRISRLTVSSAD